jgi:hypothetical protein
MTVINKLYCISFHGVGCESPITEHCVVCEAGICALHIYERAKCGKKMCHTCWTINGKYFCPTHSPIN